VTHQGSGVRAKNRKWRERKARSAEKKTPRKNPNGSRRKKALTQGIEEVKGKNVLRRNYFHNPQLTTWTGRSFRERKHQRGTGEGLSDREIKTDDRRGSLCRRNAKKGRKRKISPKVCQHRKNSRRGVWSCSHELRLPDTRGWRTFEKKE